MSNPKLSTLSDPFNSGTINTTLWNSITAGTASLDTVNDLVVLAQPTVSGTVNTFGSNTVYDATSSQIYAQVAPVANGAGGTNTVFKLTVDANDSVAIRLAAGVFEVTLQTAGVTVTSTLATYSPDAHRWWRLRESSGTMYADFSQDGFNWSTLWSSTYTWLATAVTFAFQAKATATEVAGNYATIQHVNTMLGGPANMNWPLVEDGWAPIWNCNGGDLPLDQYVALTSRVLQQSSVSRGRQYELDQVRAGETSAVLSNTDGLLDPTNSSGPYYGHIQPYQPWRRRCQWPPTRNLLSQAQATGGDLGGQPLGVINGSNSGPDIFSSTDPTGGSFVASATAWQGGTVIQMAVPTTATAMTSACYTKQAAVSIGTTYSASVWVRNVTPSTTVQVAAAFRWNNAANVITSTSAGTTTTLTGSATAGWTQLTVTGTAPAGTAYATCSTLLVTVPAAACSVQVDGWQMEQAAVPSTWTCPGTWYGLFAGFTEQWQSSWTMGGTYGLVTPTGVDAMALLSQVTLAAPITEEVNAAAPRFLYDLSDPAGSAYATDQTGNCPPAAVSSGKYGSGSWVFGTSITAANLATGVYIGSGGTVATLANPSPGTNLIDGATYLSLGSAGITGPANPGLWTRMIAFRYIGPTPTSRAYIWSAMDSQRSGGIPSGSQILVYLDTTGKPVLFLQGPGGVNVSTYFGGATDCADSNWHLLVFGWDQATGSVVASQDGSTSAYLGPYGSTLTPTGLIADNVGGWVDVTVGNGTAWNYAGDLSYACEWPTFDDTGTMITELYAAWRSACAGESSNARYSRILRYAGYIGPTNIQTGVTMDMGPATDLAGSDALSCLQGVVDTENGAHFVDRYGTVTFQSRANRYNATVPAYTFGENTAAGEWPYEDCQIVLDPTHISSVVQITQNSSNQVFAAQDKTSQVDYFPRTLTRTINAGSTLECQAAADYLLSRYKQPASRISSLVLHPSANPAMWPMCLSLELSTRIAVNRRPPSAPEISLQQFLENMQWSWDDTGEATLTLQASPVDLTPYQVFTAFRTTLNASIAPGATSITINAGLDNTNLAAAQIPSGLQLVLSQNTANAETVTVNRVAATSSGWTTCVITLVSATANSHSANDIVCEVLPSGVTNPGTWDASAAFDETNFAY